QHGPFDFARHGHAQRTRSLRDTLIGLSNVRPIDMRAYWVHQRTVVVLLLVAASGCGSGFDATVRGTAKLNQTALQRGTVSFIAKQSGPSGYGLIANDGSYSIMTGRTEGLPAGDYAVTVASNEPSTPDKNPGAPPMPGKPITPAWYRDVAQTPLKFT